MRERGFLRCGISRRAIFAVQDEVTNEWSGQDVDFCRALSAAIFDGVTNTVRFTSLSATDRFIALQQGDVDVLSRITTVTLERDVLEPSTGQGFSFAQPNFYDGLSFGGIPPYGMYSIVTFLFLFFFFLSDLLLGIQQEIVPILSILVPMNAKVSEFVLPKGPPSLRDSVISFPLRILSLGVPTCLLSKVYKTDHATQWLVGSLTCPEPTWKQMEDTPAPTRLAIAV